MNPEEIIRLGQDIIYDESYFEEARYRTAISRIYYGTLHHLRIIKRLLHIDTRYLHSELIDAIKDLDNILGNYLGNMRDFRTEADYYINQNLGKKTLDEFLKFFNRVKERIE